MIIDEQLRKCVAFLYVDGVDIETGMPIKKAVGTAFFVGIPLVGNCGTVYIVTARHVVEGSKKSGDLYIRINTRDGEYEDCRILYSSWIFHSVTDVAVATVSMKENFDVMYFPFASLATDEYILGRKIDVGDDVFIVGLFSVLPGESRNLPIVRFGKIASMPTEKINVEIFPGSNLRTKIDAFLIETMSWGGESGSPVSVYYPPDRIHGILDTKIYPPTLIGLINGHCEIPRKLSLHGDLSTYGSGQVSMNAGIAIIVPAQKIIDTLMSDVLLEQRTRMTMLLEANNSYVAANAGPK